LLRHLDSYRASPHWSWPAPEGWRYGELLDGYPPEEHVQVDRDLGVIFLEPPGLRDDLRRIRGVEPEMATALRNLGIHRFRQIADWSEQNVAGVSSRLGLVPGWIYSRRWIPQAIALCRLA
jgi:hypothetical protein